MVFLKKLIASVLASISLVSGGDDGWFPVEKVEAEQSFSKKDPSIWVLFSKDLGWGQFSVRFPEDPTYRYIGEGNLEIVSKKEEQLYTLRILKQPPPERAGQKVVQSNDHFFVFTTNSGDSETLEKVVSSLKIIA